MTGAADKGATRLRARRIRLALWLGAAALSVGVVAIVGRLQLDAYQRVLGSSRRQTIGAAAGIIRALDQELDASLGPLLALRNSVTTTEPGPLQTALDEVHARHPELGNFVALAGNGEVIAFTRPPRPTGWRRTLAAPSHEALGARVRVSVSAVQAGFLPSVWVVVDSRVAEPAAFGARIDSQRATEMLRHSMLSANGVLSVFSTDGELFASNRERAGQSWAMPSGLPGASNGTYDDGDYMYAWSASSTYPLVVRVGVDRSAIRAEWLRQAEATVIATLVLLLILNGVAAWLGRAYVRQGTLLEALTRSARHLGDVQRSGHIGLWEADLRSRTIVWSGHVYEITGLSIDRMGGRFGTYYALVHEEDRPAITAWVERFTHGDGPYELEHRLCRPDGHELRVNLRAARITNEEGTTILAGTISEITALHETRQRLRDSDRDLAASEAAYRKLLSRMPLPLLVVRDDRIDFANPLAEERLGIPGQVLIGRGASELMDADALAAIRAGSGENAGVIAWLEPIQGMPFEAELALSEYKDSRGRGTLVIVRDVTEQRRYEERLNHQATHDELTGLPNRRALREQLDGLVRESIRDKSGLMVLFIDLDHFKFINDALGHTLGDQVLRDVTLKLGDALDGLGHIGRFGGDEFVAMLPFSGPPAKALDVLPRIQRAIEEPLEVGGTVQRLKCSIGVAFATRDGADADTLIRNADTAMYDAKRSGRHTWKRYSADMHATAMARLTVISRLAPAHLDDELALAWQPQYDSLTGKPIGVEALLRWPMAPGDLAWPDQLIPLLEETGAIVPVGQWVLREACRQQRRVIEMLGEGCRVAVNISAQQLAHADLVAEVRQALRETGASASALELELTESAFMNEPERAIRTLHELRAMGVSIALDDFGTGYSNLTYLSRLPLDKMKVDRHFITSLLEGAADASICRSIIFLARNLNLRVVAEGVETQSQREWLEREGCFAMQGFLFSRPVPLDELGRKPELIL